jgi:hypothetical protein
MADHAGDEVPCTFQPLAHQNRTEAGNAEQHNEAEDENDDGELNERKPFLSPDDLNSRRRLHFPDHRLPGR